MTQVQLLTHEYPQDHPWLPGIRSQFDHIHFVDDLQNVREDVLVIAGSDIRSWHIRNWLNRQQPALYIGRGYVGNHATKHRELWRVSVNSWANTKLLSVPHSRWAVMNLPRHPWKVTQVKNVLIAPSKLTTLSWSNMNPDQWAENMAAKFPGANIKIRYKARKPWQRWETLWADFDWADLVVGQSSAITCEAFWYGKKVISTEPCLTWAAERATVDDWQNPSEPKLRDAWHEHLAWSQYTVQEWTSGEALRLINQYTGSAYNYDPEYQYNFAIEN
jgi:hypothetical protein